MSIDVVDHENSGLVLEVCRKPVVLGVPDGQVGETLDDRLSPLTQNVEGQNAGGGGNLGEEPSLVFSHSRKTHWKSFGSLGDH